MENNNIMNINPAPVAPAMETPVNPAPVYYANKNAVKEAIKAVKMPGSVRSDLWKARNMFRDFVLSLHAGGIFNPVLFDETSALFHKIILFVHGLDIPGGVIMSDLLAALVSASLNKKTLKKDTKIAGPGAFTSFVKGYAINQYGNDFAFTAGKNPDEKEKKESKPKKSAKEAAIDRIAALPADELAAVIELLMNKAA